MRAVICRKYGGPEVVEIAEVAKPNPGPRDVLVKVHATTVTAADWRLRSATVPRGMGLLFRLALGVFGPRQKILGTELAGVVEAVGAQVSAFAPGDRVMAFCGAGLACHAEYRVVKPTEAMIGIPDGVADEVAAALAFGGATALHFLRDRAAVAPGERVLVNGASGAVGSAAVQIAKHLGAHVTGVTSEKNAALVRELGADEVIDYTTEDFTETRRAAYDVIVDCVGTAPFRRASASLAEGGRLCLVEAATLGRLLGATLRSKRGTKRVIGGVAPERREDLEALVGLVAAGAYRPVIEHRLPFAQAAEAHALVESRRKRGNVVLLMR